MADLDPTRQRILDAAGSLFAVHGFDAVSIREITKAAEVNTAAVNYHFRNKEELYIAAVRHASIECERLTPTPNDWPPGTAAEERLRDYIAAFLHRLMRSDGVAWHRLLIFRELAEPRLGACEQFVENMVRPSFHALMGIVRDLVPANTPDRLVRLLSASIVGQILHYHHCRHVIRLLEGAEGYAALEEPILVEHITQFSLAALRGYPWKTNEGCP
ncbi:MAG: CerR family C-terminal domain-containing protein [Gemmataceae bacterium]